MRHIAPRLAFGGLIILLAAADKPPPARVDSVTDTYFGKTITDPYRWMETPGPELDAWAHAQNDYARAMIAAIPGRAALLAHMNDIAAKMTIVESVTPMGHRLFFLRRAPAMIWPS